MAGPGHAGTYSRWRQQRRGGLGRIPVSSTACRSAPRVGTRHIQPLFEPIRTITASPGASRLFKHAEARRSALACHPQHDAEAAAENLGGRDPRRSRGLA